MKRYNVSPPSRLKYRTKSEVSSNPNGRIKHSKPPTLIIFLKEPRAGMVKTRLSKAMGCEMATHIYKLSLQYMSRMFAASRLSFCAYVSPPAIIEYIDTLLPNAKEIYYQRGVDLGQRMKIAMCEQYFHTHQSVILVGSDCVRIEAHHIDMAQKILKINDIVIGPCSDGGYYLIGACESVLTDDRKINGIFDDIEWSTSEVLRQTIKKAKKMGLSIGFLQTLPDIDYVGDIKFNELQKLLPM